MFLYEFNQFRLLAELFIKVYGFTCTKPPEYQQQIAGNVENFLSAFPVRYIWKLIKILKHHAGTNHSVTGTAPEDLIADGTNM